MNNKIIRALYDENSVTVYQAFNKSIAETAVANQTFISPPFKKERMTWIKPSFLWMMYRSNWAEKQNQEHILAIKIERSGFEWALNNSCLSQFDRTIYATYEDWKNKLLTSPVRIQWDPEKDIFLHPMGYKSIQIGLSGIAVEKYLTKWIIRIDDITEHCKSIRQLIVLGNIVQANILLPIERPYPLLEKNLQDIIIIADDI